MKKSIHLGIAIVASIVVAGCGGKGGSVVARVNGEAIGQDDLTFAMDFKPSVRVIDANGRTGDARVSGRLGFQAMQDLILRKITMQLAKDDKVSPTEKDIDAELAFQQKLNPNFMRGLTSNGLSLSRIRESLALDLAREHLLTEGITVTRAEAEQFVKQNPKAFMEPATVDLLWIVVRSGDKRAAVDKELQSGQAFSAVAQMYSDDPQIKRNKGRYAGRVLEALDPAIKKALLNVKEGAATAWVPAQQGAFVKFYVEKRTEATPIKMDDARYEVVRRDLAKRRGAEASDLTQRILKKLRSKDTKIEIEDPALKDLWTRTFEEFLKSTETATAPGTTPTAGTTK